MKRLLPICVFMFFCARTQAQRVTLKENNETLTKVFHDLEKLTGYQFFFADSDMKNAKKISINVKNDELANILNICFKDQPLTYSMSGNTVMIKLKDENLKKNESLNSIVNDRVGGHVTDSGGIALVGASVLVKGSNIGTTTDAKGDFILSGSNENAVLIISFTGYSSKQIRLKNNEPINISLIKSVSPLDEIQVIAYGTTTKRLSTGDISTVKAADIEKQPVDNPLEALEGRVPGMEISQQTGVPGGGVVVHIRGQNSIASGNQPLYIVDGVPYPALNLPISASVGGIILGSSNGSTGDGYLSQGSPLSYINPADIESIDVLKDASATSIYGSQGANGVVLITTKKGKAGATQININMQTGIGKVAHQMPLLNTRQYLDMRHEAFSNDGAIPNPNTDYDLTLWDTTRQTNWQKELIGGTASYTDVQASASGGNSNTQYLIGVGYHRETSPFIGNFSDQQGSVHFNLSNTSPNNKFKIIFSGSYSINDNQLPGYDLTSLAMNLPPDAPALYLPDGSINWAPTAAGVSSWVMGQPAADILIRNEFTANNLVSNMILSYQVIPDLEVKSSFGYTLNQSNSLQTIPLEFYDPSTWAYDQRKSDFSDEKFHSWIIEPQVVYTKRISKGSLTALIGSTIQQSNSTGQELKATGFTSDQLMKDINSASAITVGLTTDAVYKYNAAFGRLSANWDNEFLLDASIRRDGSSRFGPANQFHNFWAIGTGWIFSQEKWIKDHLTFLSFGKLKLSYGTTGNDQVGNYTFLDTYGSVNYGVPYLGATGLTPTSIYTPDLEWEETKKLEAGIDLAFLKDRITFSAGVYRNRSTNQLLGYVLPMIAGFTSVEKNFSALVQNEGVELVLQTVNIQTRNFKWESSFNFSSNSNLLLSGAPGLSQYYQMKVGYPLQGRLVYRFLGVDPFTGLYQVADSKGNPVKNPNPLTDANVPINTAPRFFGGLSNSISYKTIRLDFLFSFTSQPTVGQFLYTDVPGRFNADVGNQPTTVLNHWSTPGDVRPIEKFSENSYGVALPASNAAASSQVYGDGSFIRLKNVSLSWQLPASCNKTLHMQNAGVFIHGQNLFTITSYKGLDPETVNSGGLPPLRVVTFGIHCTL